MKSKRTCSICGWAEGRVSYVKKHALYLCEKHRNSFKLHGESIDDRPPKSRKRYNEFCIKDTYAEIILYDVFNYEIAKTKIDISDIEKCKHIKWGLKNDNGYVCGTLNNKKIYLHRFLLEASNTKVVDHKDHNKLNNCKENLRLCSSSQNNMNKKKLSRNTSGVTGVTWDKTNKKWKSSINVGGKYIHLGRYEDLEDGKNIRLEAEKKYFGDFRYKEENND